ncbi:hypothetical protein [Arenibacter echinorum]|uniref:Uncharacterized protein n=1 Tax=Arenibacter echinorum TaxID=440515 RepID=A0A327RF33_9FLAO|nr:hypothetical protein [Arenibacter echinorum]RAJ14053.1 hypothetical protein LV92_01170 [Arenibacter echinorum]
MKSRLIISTLIFFALHTGMMSQNNKKSVQEKSNDNESYVLTDVSYINDAVFMGRRDSIAAPYIFPSIGYYDKTGFFADASVSYLTASNENRVDLFLISSGFIFNGSKISGGISGTAYFFNEDSYNVRSEVIGDITGVLSYDLKFLEITLSASTYFNKESSVDIFTGLKLDRTFYTLGNKLLLDPGISLYAGSQYFYQEYYSSSRLGNRKGKGKGTIVTEPTTSTVVEIKEASEFNLLNLELSLPAQFYHKQFIFSITPSLSFPQSSATISTEDTIIKEELKNTFYWTIGVSYWFYTKKGN